MKTTRKPVTCSGPSVKNRVPMPTVIENVPPRYNWGWYSREEPRMHLQVIDPREKLKYKVWLEKQGRRVFDPVGEIPAKILRALKKEVEENRHIIERQWVRLMIHKGWLQAFLEGAAVKLIMYPRTENRVRVVPLLGKEQHLAPEAVKELKPEDVTLSYRMASIEFWPRLPPAERQDIEIAPYLWKD